MNIQNLKDFLENNCFSVDDLYHRFLYATSTTPIDAFTYNDYKVAHLIVARCIFLQESGQDEWIETGILWDLCSLYYGRTKGQLVDESVYTHYTSLCEWFEIEPKPFSYFYPIKAFDTLIRKGEAETYLLKAIGKIGHTSINRNAYLDYLYKLNYVGPDFINEQRTKFYKESGGAV